MPLSLVGSGQPRTAHDVRESLGKHPGQVTAQDLRGNQVRLEHSHQNPPSYMLTEYDGEEDAIIRRQRSYLESDLDLAVADFACLVGLNGS